MTYAELDRMLQGRCRERRKLANNTYARREGDVLYIRLHATDILTFYPDGSVKVYVGRWDTMTTRQRLSRFLPCGYYVYRDRGVTYVKRRWHRDGDVELRDGWVVSPEEVALGLLTMEGS